MLLDNSYIHEVEKKHSHNFCGVLLLIQEIGKYDTVGTVQHYSIKEYVKNEHKLYCSTSIFPIFLS